MGGAEPGLCYVLCCFQSREFVAFLLASLYREQDTFVVHCDRKAPQDLKFYLDAVSSRYENIIRLESQHYSWAGYSHVRVCLEAVATALQVSRTWTHLVFLSEQHLPLKRPEDIAAELYGRGSVLAIRPAAQMGDAERADIENRFIARYRELPGVGAFAVGLADRGEAYIDRVHHGSNWMVLCREHCALLIEADQHGRMRLFEDTVHPEETAMQSVIAPYMRDRDKKDLILVAWPHLTDNTNLEASEDLFRSATATGHLFIRKRKRELSPFIRTFITANHFCESIYALSDEITTVGGNRNVRLSAAYCDELVSDLGRSVSGPVDVLRFGRGRPGEAPVFHLSLTSGAMRPGLSVRILSENLVDFRVCMIDASGFAGIFPAPFVSQGRLHSTARVKVFGIFGQTDILPLDIEGGGFVSIAPGRSVRPVVELAARFLLAATQMPLT